jgi:hypothetical protein
MRPGDLSGYGPVGTNCPRMPTTTGGGIPPKVEKAELTVIEYAVGTGTEGDPVRAAWAFYAPNGQHLFTVDHERVLCFTHSPGAIIRSNCVDVV